MYVYMIDKLGAPLFADGGVVNLTSPLDEGINSTGEKTHPVLKINRKSNAEAILVQNRGPLRQRWTLQGAA